MRYPQLLCIACPLLISGCSVLIANCGKDLNVLDDRDQVRQEFGEPVATGIEDGKQFEDFRSHWKVADPYWGGPGYAMGMILTAGLYELGGFPYQVYCASRATIVGQDIRFYYDRAGNVSECRVDGHYGFSNAARRRSFGENRDPYRSSGLIDLDAPPLPNSGDQADPNAKLGFVNPDAPRGDDDSR